jgi:hypothetical protein
MKRFGRLIAVEQIPTKELNARGDPRYYHCVCDCGGTTDARGYSLAAGILKSCGCAQRESAVKTGKSRSGIAIKHGGCIGQHTKQNVDKEIAGAYLSWRAMMTRCFNKKCSGYTLYGGIGISVCNRWKDFSYFLEDMGKRPCGMSIDRIDGTKGYFKENCRWANKVEQANNKPGFNRIIEFNGKVQSVSLWAKEVGVSVALLFQRLNRGWSIERALTTRARTLPHRILK